MTLKCWSSSQVEKRFWSCMPILKKITSPRPKKKKKKPKTTLKKREAQSPKQLGCKNKNKAQGVANEQMIETGQEPKLWAIERTRNKEIFEDHKNVKKMIGSKQEIQYKSKGAGNQFIRAIYAKVQSYSYIVTRNSRCNRDRQAIFD